MKAWEHKKEREGKREEKNETETLRFAQCYS